MVNNFSKKYSQVPWYLSIKKNVSCNENNSSTLVLSYFLEVEVHSIIHSLQNIKKTTTTTTTRRCTCLFQDLVWVALRLSRIWRILQIEEGVIHKFRSQWKMVKWEICVFNFKQTDISQRIVYKVLSLKQSIKFYYQASWAGCLFGLEAFQRV